MFLRRMRFLLVLMYTASLFAIIVFALDAGSYIPFNIGQPHVSCFVDISFRLTAYCVILCEFHCTD